MSIDHTFYVGLSVACVSIISAHLLNGRSVKGQGGLHGNEIAESGTKAILGKTLIDGFSLWSMLDFLK